MRKRTSTAIAILAIAALYGCAATYTTPAGGVSLAEEISVTDLREHFATEPASRFPANIAVARLQEGGYYSFSNRGYGNGRYSVVTTRDIEPDEAYETLEGLPLIRGVAPIGRLLLPNRLNSVDELRSPAARLKADLLLVYTVDSTFVVDGNSLDPLSAISLGFIRNREAHVTSTVAGALLDVRTGFVYGTTEATATRSKKATVWSTQQAADSSRIVAEKQAFESFIESFSSLWADVVNEHVAVIPAASKSTPEPAGWYSVQFDN